MNKLKFKPTTTKHNNNTNNNNQLTPELNHHLILSRRSRALAQALPTQARKSNSSSQTATNSQTKPQTNPQTKPQTNPQTNPAFTIIEVVLVLAIAGLIFLMVFIALPTLQRNQRDTQRKNDMARLKTAIDSYKSNNRGQMPTASQLTGYSYATSFAKSYLKTDTEAFNDPGGESYYLWRDNAYAVNGADGWKPGRYSQYNVRYIFITAAKKCSGEGIISGGGENNYTIQYSLEGGGWICLDG